MESEQLLAQQPNKIGQQPKKQQTQPLLEDEKINVQYSEEQDFRSLQMFFKQISGHKYMFLDHNKNVCKMSNSKEIYFYSVMCPQNLKSFVPNFNGNFFLRQGVDKLDLDEEFDISRYCPTTSVLSKNSSSSSLDDSFSIKDLQEILLLDSYNNANKNQYQIPQDIIHQYLKPCNLNNPTSNLTKELGEELTSLITQNSQFNSKIKDHINFDENDDALATTKLAANLKDLQDNSINKEYDYNAPQFSDQFQKSTQIDLIQNQCNRLSPEQINDKKVQKKNLITAEEYQMKIERTLDELVNKQAWLGRLLKKTNKLNFYDIPFISLENLTHPYKHPCMMDLKLGSVAYNPKKSQKQQLKILNSTSGCFSFRISGMEVYKTIDKKMIFRNKYWGRSIKKEEIVDSLAIFFYNGCCIRTNVVKSFMDQIRQLLEVVVQCKGFRFHSSSLLLVYDGYMADKNLETDCQSEEHMRFINTFKKSANGLKKSGFIETENKFADLRVIDFANFVYEEGNDKPDEDMINGLENLLSIFQQLLDKPVQITKVEAYISPEAQALAQEYLQQQDELMASSIERASASAFE